MNSEPLIFLRSLRRTVWRGQKTPPRNRHRIRLALFWEIIATEAACRILPADALSMPMVEHDPSRWAAPRCRRTLPRVTCHRAEDGTRFCILSQAHDPVIRVALETERGTVLADMERALRPGIDRKPGRRYPESRIIVKPQRRKSGTHL